MWLPGWTDFIADSAPAARYIYLSLGKKEENTRHKVMSAVGDNIRRQYELLIQQGVGAMLEWNEGNHFTEPEIRTARGFARCINMENSL